MRKHSFKKRIAAVLLGFALCATTAIGYEGGAGTVHASELVTKTTIMECSVWSAPNTAEENRVKKIPAGYNVTVYPEVVESTAGDGKTFYMTSKGCYILCKCFGDTDETPAAYGDNGTPVLVYELPEGFIESGDDMWYAPDYVANINIMTNDNDPTTFQYTEEAFCKEVEYLFEQVCGCEIEVNCTEFTKSKMNGCNTLVIRTSYRLLDVEVEQIQFAVETGKNKTTVITYTQQAGGPWTDAFNASLNSMSIKYVK